EFNAQMRQDLQQELQRRTASWMEVRCLDTRTGMERLQKAFQAHGIPFLVDTDAQATLKLGFGGTTPAFALYLDDVTAEEMAVVLQQLSSEERKLEKFESVSIEAMNQDSRQKLARLLGIAAGQLEITTAKAEAGIDGSKLATSEESGNPSLKG